MSIRPLEEWMIYSLSTEELNKVKYNLTMYKCVYVRVKDFRTIEVLDSSTIRYNTKTEQYEET